MVNIRPFKIDSGAYAGILVKQYLAKMWWIYSLPAVIFIILGVNDIRFLLLALIYVFLVTPMIMAFALTMYGLVHESKYSILRKSVVADADGMEFTFIDNDGNVTEKSRIEWSKIKHIHPTNKYLIFPLKKGRFRFIAIPYTAFEDKFHMTDFLEIAKSSALEIK